MLRAGDLVAGQQVRRDPRAPAAPSLTVVMPTWARASSGLLQRALASVVEQSFADFELIVVDDGSTDGSEDVVRDLQRRDPRVVHVRHEVNSGLPALRVNEGIELARGRWIAFQFDDDAWTAGALAALVAVAREQPQPAVTYGAARLRYPGDLEQRLPDDVVNVLTLSFRNRIANNSVLVPRALFDRCGLYDCHVGMRRLTDWDLWLRLADVVPFVTVEAVVSEVRVFADERAVGVAFPFDAPLFRFLQSIPRNRLLLPGRWRDYPVDSLRVGDVEVAGPLRKRLAEQHVAPFRDRLRRGLPQLAEESELPSSSPRPALVAMDAFYPSFAMCAGQYDLPASRHGLPKMHYQPLLQVEPGWPAENELLLLVRTSLEPGVRMLREARAAPARSCWRYGCGTTG